VGTSLLLMGGFSLSVDYKTAMLARMVQMAGIGFLWVPINAAAYSFLKPEKSTQASGFLNLSRNVGGGVGIAMVTTLQERSAQAHQAILSANMTALNPAYRSVLAQTAQNLIAQGLNAARAAALAPGLLYQDLGRQAGMLGYMEDFRFMAVICFASLGLLVFLKKSDRSKATVSVH
jgi:DHA2 family multidrug resistance protein